MNEIFGIFFFNKYCTDIASKSTKEFRTDYNQDILEFKDEYFHLILASKKNVNCHINLTNESVKAFGGYVFNWNDQKERKIIDKNTLDGKFLFVNYDRKLNKIELFNDKFGHFPVYYTQTKEYFCFSSNLNYILKLKDIDISINRQHVADYFFWGTTLPNSIFFNNIHLLPSSAIVNITLDKKPDFNKYNTFKVHSKYKTFDEGYEDFISVFNTVIDKYQKYFGELNFSLTGGMDTKFISSFIKTTENNQFITIRNSNIKDDENLDIIIARQVANSIGIPHKIIENHYFPVPTKFGSDYFLKQKLAIGTPPIITGIFGSELLKLQITRILNKELTQIINESTTNKLDSQFYEKSPTLKRNFSKRPSDAIIFDNLLNNNFDRTLFKSRVKATLLEFKTNMKTNPVLELSNWLTNTYYCNYYGGSRAGNISGVEFFNNFLIPFMDEKVLEVLFKIPLDHYGLQKDSIYEKFFRKEQFNDNTINQNSLISSDKLLNKNPIYFRKNNDDVLLERYLETSKLYHLEVFKNEKLNSLIMKNAWFRNCFIDFSVWLDYIDIKVNLP